MQLKKVLRNTKVSHNFERNSICCIPITHFGIEERFERMGGGSATPSKQATVQCKSFSMVDYTVYSCAVSLIIPRSSIALAIRCQVAIDWRNHPSSDFDVIHILRPPPFSSILFRYRPLLSGSPLSRPLQRNVTSTTSNKPNFGPGSR